MPAVPTTPRVKLRSTSRRIRRINAASSAITEADHEPNMRLSRAIMVMLLLHVVAVGGIFAFSFIKDRDANRSASIQIGSASNALEAEDSSVPAKRADPGLSHSSSDGAGATAHPSVHVVRVGETLTRIANDHGVTLEALVAANGASTVTNGLHPGQELKLPDKSPEPEATMPDSAAGALAIIEGRSGANLGNASNSSSVMKNAHLPPDSGKVYVVGKGESSYLIAQKLKVSYDALLKLNQIDDPKKLKLGQKLHIPAAPKPHTKS